MVTLDNAANKWGVKVNRVELQDIIPPAAIREAMEKQMKAERDRRATVTEAEGLKTSQILKAEAVREAEIKKAEGLKQAAILQAEGIAEAKIKVANAEAEAVKIIASGIGQNANPASYQVSLKYIEALTKMTDGKDNKIIYMPYEASNVLGAVAAIKDLTGGAPHKKLEKPFFAKIAQLVEQPLRKRQVRGSIPRLGSFRRKHKKGVFRIQTSENALFSV